jgi:hypothetical protein
MPQIRSWPFMAADNDDFRRARQDSYAISVAEMTRPRRKRLRHWFQRLQPAGKS